MYGELHPRGGGDTIPLMKKFLVVGRRESCDIVLRWTNVSGAHCELSLVDGFWYVKDLASSNGTKVNGTRVAERRLDPGDTLSIARHEFEIVYEPVRLGATGAPGDDNADRDPLSRSLLEAAGLERRRSRDDSRPPR
jgi:adenylate cyclase